MTTHSRRLHRSSTRLLGMFALGVVAGVTAGTSAG